METATLKHLKKCAKILQDNKALKLHFKSQIQRLETSASGELNAQNDQFQSSTKNQTVKAKDGQFECQWCFQVIQLLITLKFQIKCLKTFFLRLEVHSSKFDVIDQRDKRNL